jgi:hypothetical protein
MTTLLLGGTNVMQNSHAESRSGKRIPVDPALPLVLVIHSPRGDITVRAVDRPDVLVGYEDDVGDEDGDLTIDVRGNRIEIHPKHRAEGGWAGVAEEFDLEAVMGQISRAFRGGGSLFAAKTGKAQFGLGGGKTIDIAVEIPRSMTGRIEINSASGDASIEGFTGEIALNTMSGDVRVVGTTGALTLQSASGDLHVEDATGRLTARTANGDVHVTSGRCNGFDIKTASGDTQVDAALVGDGQFRVQTASGDVHLSLHGPAADGDDPAATLAFQTISGDAQVAPPFRKIDRRRWQSGRGEHGPRIEVSTVNGDLSATIAEAEGAVVPASSPVDFREAASPAQDSAARLTVLEAVERGEIDVEEALRQLDEDDASVNS